MFLKSFDSEFCYIQLQFTDQNSNPLELEDKINITLAIDYNVTYKNDALVSST